MHDLGIGLWDARSRHGHAGARGPALVRRCTDAHSLVSKLDVVHGGPWEVGTIHATCMDHRSLQLKNYGAQAFFA